MAACFGPERVAFLLAGSRPLEALVVGLAPRLIPFPLDAPDHYAAIIPTFVDRYRAWAQARGVEVTPGRPVRVRIHPAVLRALGSDVGRLLGPDARIVEAPPLDDQSWITAETADNADDDPLV